MTRHRWRDYDDGFDEATLHDDEEAYFELIKRRPKLRAAPRHRRWDEPSAAKLAEARRLKRHLERENAWGEPY